MPEDQVKIKKESFGDDSVASSDGSHYPYGTSLNFDGDLIEELDAGNLAVGDIVEVRGFAFVERKSEHSSTEYSDKSISIQMTTLKLKRETDDRAVQVHHDFCC